MTKSMMTEDASENESSSYVISTLLMQRWL